MVHLCTWTEWSSQRVLCTGQILSMRCEYVLVDEVRRLSHDAYDDVVGIPVFDWSSSTSSYRKDICPDCINNYTMPIITDFF